jgi:2-(acetamidomethylene)succinate hydrolase
MPAPTVELGPDGLHRTRGAMVNIAFRVQGAGPAIVLLHGTSANHAVWAPIADALASEATVICLDQRGHGRSDKPPVGYTGADFAGDVITVLDALGVDRAIIGGHSLGARNSWVVGAQHPERTSAVLAVDYTPYVEIDVLDELQERVAGGDRRFSSVAEIEGYLHERYPRMPLDAVARRAAWGYERLDDDRWRPLSDPAAMTQLVNGLRTPWAVEFGAVSAPMTHIRGAHSTILSEDAWRAAVTDRPLDRFIVDPDSDHYVPEENPELVIAELTLLLKTTA